jgi:hypothetical protein
MQSLITALAMVAVATASFAIGRSTSESTPASATKVERAASIDTAKLQSMSPKLPELRVDSPY